MSATGDVDLSQSTLLKLISPLWNTDFPITLHASTHNRIKLPLLCKTQLNVDDCLKGPVICVHFNGSYMVGQSLLFKVVEQSDRIATERDCLCLKLLP